MENVDLNPSRKINTMADGVKTRPFYVKHLSLDDDSLLSRIKTQYSLETDAKALRFLIRRAADQI